MNASPVATIVRSWVELYTRGMPASLRDARRDEVDDDLWCQHEEAMTSGRSQRSLGGEMLLRLVLGMPADLSWRLTYRRHVAAPEIERDSSTGTRAIGLLAVAGGASFGISVCLVLLFGMGMWRGQYALVLVALGLVGGTACAGASIGMVLRFRHQLTGLGSLGGALSGFGAFFGATLEYGLALFPIGSAVLAWELSRIGVLSRTLAMVHGVGAFAFLVVISSATVTQMLVYLAIPYFVSWLAIGASFLRGVPLARNNHLV